MKTLEITDYQQQAIDFLNATNSKITINFSHSGKHFEGDKEDRDIYKVKLSRGSRSFTFDFGNSINHSGFYYTKGRQRTELDRALLENTNIKSLIKNNDWDFMPHIDKIHYPVAPNEYSILACLTKYDPDTFENFCSEFGYDTDSRSAKKMYKAVVKEYDKVCSLYSPEEMEQLGEIN